MCKLKENCLELDYHKNNTEKPEKAVFLAFFDILVKFTQEGRFQPKTGKNQIFMIFKLKAIRKMSITDGPWNLSFQHFED